MTLRQQLTFWLVALLVFVALLWLLSGILLPFVAGAALAYLQSPLVDWLDYNGYTVVTKSIKEYIDANGRRKLKGSMDIELAVDAMEIAEHIDQMVLFSGDGDFRPLVEAVQRRGVRVIVVSTISSQPSMIADELRRQADVFIDLAELRAKVARPLVERLVPREPRSSSTAVGAAQHQGLGGS